jgi:hypothetical protein
MSPLRMLEESAGLVRAGPVRTAFFGGLLAADGRGAARRSVWTSVRTVGAAVADRVMARVRD